MSDWAFCVAPMMDWTDRHDRAFLRLISSRARLYTEMVTAGAIVHGDRARLLRFDASEHPVALQLGGSEPSRLAEAARIGAALGYDEINLNCGCPSDRVQSGSFGACLMREPDLVAACVEAMREAVSVPVTVKCRIGVDDQVPEEVLPSFARTMREAGVDALIVHARKAWLKGLSPKENRDVPPLDYPLVHALKRAMPDLPIVINGGIDTLDEAKAHLDHVDGVMLGRAAYQTPYLLADVDRRFFRVMHCPRSRAKVVEDYLPYIERALGEGVPLSAITRHMVGLFHGVPGARAWRRHLSVEAPRRPSDIRVVTEALAEVAPSAAPLALSA